MIALLAVVLMNPGLAAFRAPDRNGQSCASCHSPDGIELRGFSAVNLRRRALRHFSDPSVLVEYLSGSGVAARRPYQPEGSVLGGSARFRDAAFGAVLKKRLPVLMGVPLTTVADAERAAAEVQAVDLFTLPIGIPMNRLSSDGFHGKEQGTIADWIPDVPVTPDFAAQDAYLASPTSANLAKLNQQAVANLGSAGALAKLKYQALLRYQHELRTGNRLPVRGENPFWEIGEFGRLSSGQSLPNLGFPGSVVAESKATQMAEMRVPWYWLGWMFDPGLQFSGAQPETKRADYFVKSLTEDGPYPIHTLFMLTRKLVEQGTNPAAWNSHFAQQYEIYYSFWLLDELSMALSPDAKRIEENSFRMSLLLLKRDTLRSGSVIRPESQRTQVRLMQAEFKRIGAPADALCQEVLQAIELAKPVR